MRLIFLIVSVLLTVDCRSAAPLPDFSVDAFINELQGNSDQLSQRALLMVKNLQETLKQVGDGDVAIRRDIIMQLEAEHNRYLFILGRRGKRQERGQKLSIPLPIIVPLPVREEGLLDQQQRRSSIEPVAVRDYDQAIDEEDRRYGEALSLLDGRAPGYDLDRALAERDHQVNMKRIEREYGEQEFNEKQGGDLDPKKSKTYRIGV